MIVLRTEDEVRKVRPDYGGIVQAGLGYVIVTAPSEDPAYAFCSRFSAPWAGIDEDPVTGVAHCSLGPYWCSRLGPYWCQRLGATDLLGHQISRREGIIRVRDRGDRVDIMGQAVTTIEGRLLQ